MPAINPQYLAHKCVEENTVIAQEAIARCLAVDMDGNIVTTPGSYVYGFALFDVEANKPLTVETMGECIALSGAPITKGIDLANDADGKLIPAAAGQNIVGRAIEDVAAADQYFILKKTDEGTK